MLLLLDKQIRISACSESPSLQGDCDAHHASWVSFHGIPVNLWGNEMFSTLDDLYGGLVKVSNETLSGVIITEIRLMVKGPTPDKNWGFTFKYKGHRIHASASRDLAQSESSFSPLRRMCFSDNVISGNVSAPTSKATTSGEMHHLEAATFLSHLLPIRSQLLLRIRMVLMALQREGNLIQIQSQSHVV